MLTIKIIKTLPENATKLPNDVPLNNIEALAASEDAIILDFPSFTDGRAFSQARKLRRHGYKGDLIASGDIRSDQARHYAQVGFSTLHFSENFNPEIIDKALGRYALPYQSSSHRAEIIYEQRLHKEKLTILSGGGAFD